VKMTNQVRAIANLAFYKGEIRGYEIHMGRTYFSNSNLKSAFTIIERSGKKVMDDDGGAVNRDGNVIGTYIHGIFDNDAFRQAFLNHLRLKKGLSPVSAGASMDKGDNKSGIDWDMEYNKLADFVRRNIDMDTVYDIINGT